MKVKDEFILKTVADQTIVVPVGKASINFQAMISLNETGRFLFEHLKTHQSIENLSSLLEMHYEVDIARATKDVIDFIKILDKNQILEY